MFNIQLQWNSPLFSDRVRAQSTVSQWMTLLPPVDVNAAVSGMWLGKKRSPDTWPSTKITSRQIIINAVSYRYKAE
jgi:hypothetical protein